LTKLIIISKTSQEERGERKKNEGNYQMGGGKEDQGKKAEKPGRRAWAIGLERKYASKKKRSMG